VVLAAGESSAPGAHEALETLCRLYWPPLYAYVRRSGYSPEEAQDLTQGFFERFLQKQYFEHVDQVRGRFRTFLLTALKHYLVNEWVKAGRQKRGGGQAAFSLDTRDAEQDYGAELADHLSPDKIYERRWAITMLDRVLHSLQQDYEENKKARLFTDLKDYIWGERGGTPYTEVAANLQMTEAAIKVAVHRMRQKFGEMLRSEIAQTVASPTEVDEELRHLIAIVRG
jgi:RNA polymerase sigma-70 factor (ECF subfamily)